jgi:hypothetical protein
VRECDTLEEAEETKKEKEQLHPTWKHKIIEQPVWENKEVYWESND